MSSNEKRQSMMGGEAEMVMNAITEGQKRRASESREPAGNMTAEFPPHAAVLQDPGEIDERAAFEKFMSKRGWAAVYAGDGLYEMPSVQQQWEVWQGRAAIAAPQKQAERAGVPEKVARMLESAFFGQANWLRVREVTAAIRALAAPSPQEGNDCDNCHKCLDGKTTDAGFPIALTRMILCPNCGNKRCPKASDHTLACTNSNEPGQVGSVYGIATPANTAAANEDGRQPELTVWYGPMPESSGRSNFTAILMRKDGDKLDNMTDGITIDRSEYPDRVRYEADRVRYLIGELAKRPSILDYDADKHSGYAQPDIAAADADGQKGEAA